MVFYDDDNIALPDSNSINNIIPSPSSTSISTSKRKSKNVIKLNNKNTLDPDEIIEEKLDMFDIDNKQEKIEKVENKKVNDDIKENNNPLSNIELDGKTKERRSSKDNIKNKPLKLKDKIEREDINIPSKLTFDILLGLLLIFSYFSAVLIIYYTPVGRDFSLGLFFLALFGLIASFYSKSYLIRLFYYGLLIWFAFAIGYFFSAIFNTNSYLSRVVTTRCNHTNFVTKYSDFNTCYYSVRNQLLAQCSVMFGVFFIGFIMILNRTSTYISDLEKSLISNNSNLPKGDDNDEF